MVQAKDWWPTDCGHVVCPPSLWVCVFLWRYRFISVSVGVHATRVASQLGKILCRAYATGAQREIFAAHWVWIKRCRLSANPCLYIYDILFCSSATLHIWIRVCPRVADAGGSPTRMDAGYWVLLWGFRISLFSIFVACFWGRNKIKSPWYWCSKYHF